MAEDSADQLKADILASDPEAVYTTLDDRAEEFLVACVKFARLWQTQDDPWLGIRCLADALVWVKEAQERMSREVSVRQKPRSTMESFRR